MVGGEVAAAGGGPAMRPVDHGQPIARGIVLYCTAVLVSLMSVVVK